jgi:adenylate kinase family enzyme
MRKVAIISSASGSGKSTLGRELASKLGVPFVELDALVHGPNWRETPDEELKSALEPILSADGWVIDGNYTHKLGNLIVDDADTVVWIDLPIRIWLPRLLSRSYRRLRGYEPLWNGNRETISAVLWGRDSLVGYALRMHFRRRREFPVALANHPVVRLRTVAEVEAFRASPRPASVDQPSTDLP